MDVDMTKLNDDGTKGDTGIDANGGWMENNTTTAYYRFWPAHNNGFHIAFFDGHIERVVFNTEGKFRQGKASGDYPQFDWNPIAGPQWNPQ